MIYRWGLLQIVLHVRKVIWTLADFVQCFLEVEASCKPRCSQLCCLMGFWGFAAHLHNHDRVYRSTYCCDCFLIVC